MQILPTKHIDGRISYSILAFILLMSDMLEWPSEDMLKYIEGYSSSPDFEDFSNNAEIIVKNKTAILLYDSALGESGTKPKVEMFLRHLEKQLVRAHYRKKYDKYVH